MALPHTIGTFTDPGVAFTVPEAWIARDQTGRPKRRRSEMSRTPASTTTPAHPRAITDVASNSPNIPFVEGEVVRYHEDVPWFYDLDRGVDHDVVSRGA